ncbi:chitinase N-terminal domain-containing protein [Tessaracoccus defluvii]|uniref:Chitinase A N-terminal domain-containing protein n=1 Tax=Tessaracoccus defluvii TaxID=1285901 RepID=A0A7H0H3G8_9ACTN|nr:chitinase N-terminal domain-containing protein [Tessaracoccus defluvii]QNP55084.1 hypothetical protein H9L22_12525 [Tessaracoccus defluvii]
MTYSTPPPNLRSLEQRIRNLEPDETGSLRHDLLLERHGREPGRVCAVDGVLTIDMTGMPGWGVPGERIAELSIGAAAAGTIRVDSIAVAGPPAVVDTEAAAPAVGVLSTTSGWQNGLADGNYEVRLNLWWGANASRVKVYENGVLIHTAELAAAGPAAQSVTVPVQGRVDGTYAYTAQLINSQGVTWAKPVSVTVKDAKPGKLALSDDNRDGNGDYTVTANLWWGTNATAYTFFQDGEPVAEGELTAASPGAQRATYTVTGMPVGTYEYTVEFRNHAGTTTSAPITVKVKR